MTRITLLTALLTLFLTAAWVADVSAQTSRQTAGSRSKMFNPSATVNAQRSEMNAKYGEGGMSTQLRNNDPSTLLGRNNTVTPTVAMLFMNAGAGGVAQMMGVDAAATQAGPSVGGLVISTTAVNDVNTTIATSTIRGTGGMYAPRLRFVRGKEESEDTDVIAQMETADRKRAAELTSDIIDKYNLPVEAANISLEFRGLTAVIQGRVPNPTVRKQIGMYLGFEPGIYSVQNNLVVDPDMSSAADTPATVLPTSNSAP